MHFRTVFSLQNGCSALYESIRYKKGKLIVIKISKISIRGLNFVVWCLGLASYSNFAPKIVLDLKKRKLVDADAVTRQHVSCRLGGLLEVKG